MTSSENTDRDKEAVSSSLNEDLSHSFDVVLKDFPDVLVYIKRLNEHIKKQQETLVKLFEKLKEYKNSNLTNAKNGVVMVDASTQTDPKSGQLHSPESLSEHRRNAAGDNQCSEWALASSLDKTRSLADEVKKVAESAMQQTGFVYEETSGMYYDYNTGYYYNAEMGLYYDGNSGTYLYYNEGTKSYEFHSQASVRAPPAGFDKPVVSPLTLASQYVLQATLQHRELPMKSVAAVTLPNPTISSKPKTDKALKEKAIDGNKKVDEHVDTEVEQPSKKKVEQPSKKKGEQPSNKKVEQTSSRKREKTSKQKVKKTSKRKVEQPKPAILDPLETKESELQFTGSNPMAPLPDECLDSFAPQDLRNDQDSSKEIRHQHKRKGKHKKHKSKKKRKKRHRSCSRSENSFEEGECSDTGESEREGENDISVKRSRRNSEDQEILSERDRANSTKGKRSRKKSEDEEVTHQVPSSVVLDTTLPLSPKITDLWKKCRRLSDEAGEAWPPCMRIIVQTTAVKNLNIGTLFIVTCKGGTLGREKFHAVPIPDINISKHHGIFTFDESCGKYFFTDYGSRNGTYVNKQRLSSAKQESEPCEIAHGTIITLGSTDLLCHIHPGRETCEECEPGVVAAKKAGENEVVHHLSSTGESKSEKRLQELRRLRKRFGLEGNESKADLAPGYEDRAEIRRVTVGSLNEHAKTEVASTTESIKSSNKGFKMLSKMGWKEGESLGKDGTGLTEPVSVSQRAEKAGLGADNSFALSGGAPDVRSKLRAANWQRARQRYVQLPDTVDGGGDHDDA